MGRTACTEPQCLYKGALYLYRWSWKSRAIPLLPLWAVRPVQCLSACTRVHFTFTFGHERVELYLYSPYGPYGLYKASVPVQGCTFIVAYHLLSLNLRGSFYRYIYPIRRDASYFCLCAGCNITQLISRSHVLLPRNVSSLSSGIVLL